MNQRPLAPHAKHEPDKTQPSPTNYRKTQALGYHRFGLSWCLSAGVPAQFPHAYQCRTWILPEVSVGFAPRKDIGDQDSLLPIIDDIEYPPVANADPPASVRIPPQRDCLWRARLFRKSDDMSLNVATDWVGDAIEPTLRRLRYGDCVSHTRSQALPNDLPRDHALATCADACQSLVLRPGVGILLTEEIEACSNGHEVLPPTTDCTKKAGVNGTEDLVAGALECTSGLVEIQKSARAEFAQDSLPARRDMLNCERGGGGVLPVDTNPSSSTSAHCILSLSRFGSLKRWATEFRSRAENGNGPPGGIPSEPVGQPASVHFMPFVATAVARQVSEVTP